MVPPRQRLKTRHCAIIQADNGLEEDANLIALKRAAQIMFHRHAISALGAHGRTEGFDTIPTQTLRMHHGDFGIAQHFCATIINRGISQRHPNRRGEEDVALTKTIGCRDHFPHRFDNSRNTACILLR